MLLDYSLNTQKVRNRPLMQRRRPASVLVAPRFDTSESGYGHQNLVTASPRPEQPLHSGELAMQRWIQRHLPRPRPHSTGSYSNRESNCRPCNGSVWTCRSARLFQAWKLPRLRRGGRFHRLGGRPVEPPYPRFRPSLSASTGPRCPSPHHLTKHQHHKHDTHRPPLHPAFAPAFNNSSTHVRLTSRSPFSPHRPSQRNKTLDYALHHP
ncbi:hypothetical protein IWZ01DRAFT_318830 [Phyllosticta capitalensis]